VDTSKSVLSRDDLDVFHRDGYVRVKEAFPREVALAMQDEVWDELCEECGIDRSNCDTWRVPPKSPKRVKHSPLNQDVVSPRFRGAIDELLGAGNWAEPSNWGSFLITFPTSRDEPWDIPTTSWHWDDELTETDALTGLQIFTFFSQVLPRGGGTLIARGSHHVLRSYYDSLSAEQRNTGHAKQRRHFFGWHPWIAELTGGKQGPIGDREARFMKRATKVAGHPVQVVELTGEPGDAVFCHPLILHAPAAHNHSDWPRFMRGKGLFNHP